ncbi:MAG: hypothetical protein ISS81_03270 [Candidatus Marinimicrobia bacterium]|nr:hypothetical protein [Candidatus Neomarinimicrobiota bacterium]
MKYASHSAIALLLDNWLENPQNSRLLSSSLHYFYALVELSPAAAGAARR